MPEARGRSTERVWAARSCSRWATGGTFLILQETDPDSPCPAGHFLRLPARGSPFIHSLSSPSGPVPGQEAALDRELGVRNRLPGLEPRVVPEGGPGLQVLAHPTVRSERGAGSCPRTNVVLLWKPSVTDGQSP